MSSGTIEGTERRSRLLPYAQLLRIPNVFTAMADIAMAGLITGSLPQQMGPFLCLVVASSCLYCAGMVWNDYFDYDQDLKERPFRPLPSHRISRGAAMRLGVVLFAAGIMFAILAGIVGDGFQSGPLIVAILLVLAILLYDAWLKRTFLGPVSMGLCRFLNVLLGLTVAVDGIPSWGFVLALVVGVYIVGVTWFARKEARLSKQLELAAAALVMLTALPLALFLPALGRQQARGETVGQIGHLLFPYLLVAFGFWVGIPAAAAIRNTSPKYVQAGVKRAIIGLVVLDAVLATSLAGTVGLLVLVLLLPAMWLGKWVYST
ncbi:MAG TPA: UbiA family prenyltransferase [Gemmataceae bacterium]|nr:UbiA family prenyltransferase [Gemmataceae bacterium]